MTKRNILLVSMCLLMMSVQGAGKKTLKNTVGKSFLIGAAVTVDQVSGKDKKGQQVAIEQFNSIVAENCMKGEVIHPEEDRYFWDDADAFVDFGNKHGMSVIGHCLVWHSQPPKWMFTDASGKFVTREILIERMKSHIFTVMKRYKGKIHGWDVVNEAVEDDGSFRKSHYYNIIGPDYIELAFRFAHEADPDVELYINDFSMAKPAKRAAYCKLVRDLKSKGLRIDGIGMQSHNGRDYPDLKEYEVSIDSFAALGVKVMITELDLNMLPNPKNFGGAEISQTFEYDKAMNPYASGKMDAAGEKAFYDRYYAFFDIYHRHQHQISRVTLWGVSDNNTWLNDWPIKGRTNFPLLFDRQYNIKPVTEDIIKMFSDKK